MKSGFTRPKELKDSSSPNLFVANCGPKVGISYESIQCVFGAFGEVIGIHAADESGARVIVCFSETSSAQSAFETLNGHPCRELDGRTLHIRYSVPQPTKVRDTDSLSVSFSSTELGIPGIFIVHDFITAHQEKELLKAVDCRPWKSLSKRRVQHYGYEFLYQIRNVDPKQFLGELPAFVSPVLEKIRSFPGPDNSHSRLMDQLTVNEYPRGVGLSPHIDTHSAFDDLIFSLSLSSSCIMEFRKYNDEEDPHKSSSFVRKAIFLPPRSMLLLSGEGRYAWHHYIPHHKVDLVGGRVVRRCERRVSFTFRKVRTDSCCCEYSQHCDSQEKAKYSQIVA